MHLRHLRWEASPEPHPFIVPARIRAPESITPSVSDCFLLQTSFVVFVCIDYIMSSDKSQVFLMKKFSGFYRIQICTQTVAEYAADPAPERRFPLPGSIQTHGIAFAAKAAALCAIWLPYPAPGEKQSIRTGSTSAPRTRPPHPGKWFVLSRSYLSTGLRRSTLRLSIRGAEISQTAPECPGK